MVRKAAFLFVFMLTALATAAPYIGPEMPVDEPVYAEQILNQWGQDIAFDGTNYLVVWCDDRDIFNDYSGPDEFMTKIMGARVSPEGEVLDKSGFVISEEFVGSMAYYSYAYCATSIAFDGANYMVAWSQSYGTIHAVGVSPDGIILDMDEIIIDAAGSVKDVGISFDGDAYSLFWSSNKSIYVARIDSNGVILNPASDPIITMNEEISGLKVDFDGTNYRLAWMDSLQENQFSLLTARVSKEGVVLDIPAVTIVADTVSPLPNISCWDGECLVAWRVEAGVSAVWLDIDGTVRNAPLVVSDTVALNSSYPSAPAVFFDANSSMVAWVDVRNDSPDDKRNTSDIYVARITKDGANLDPDGILIRGGTDQLRWHPVLDSDGENLFATWSCRYYYPGPADSPYDYLIQSGIHGDIISSEAIVQEEKEMVVSSDMTWEIYPAVVFTGEEYILAWNDNRDWWSTSSWGLFGTRISKTGETATLAIGPFDNSPVNLYQPVIVRGGDVLLLLWGRFSRDASYVTNRDCLFAERMTLDGTPIDDTPYEVSCNINAENENNAVASFDGTDFLVVWKDHRPSENSLPSPALFGHRIPAHGEIMDEADVYFAATHEYYYFPGRMDLSFDGVNHLLVWSNDDALNAMRIAPDLTILDTTPIMISQTGGLPHLAFDGENYLIAWELSYVRIAPDGTIIDVPARTIPLEEGYPAVTALVYDGFNYLAVLAHGGYISDVEPNRDISAVLISSEGELLGLPFEVSNAPENERSLKSVASAGDGTAIMAYQRSRKVLAQDHRDHTDRVVYRMFYSGVAGARCEEQAHCGDGLICTANICIDPNAPDDIVETEDDILPDETVTDSDTLIEEPEEVLDADTANPTDGDKLDADAAHPDNEEPTDDETTDGTVTDNDFPPFDFDFADYGKDDHPACSCSVVF